MKYQRISVTPFEQECSLVFDANSNALVIDPGGDVQTIISQIQARKLKLELILLTHGHIDHVGAAKELAQTMQVKIYGPSCEDKPLFEGLPNQSMLFNLPHVDSFLPDTWLEHDREIRVGEINLKALHCPGHTPGHLIYYAQDQKVAFVGDVIFKQSIGRTDFPGGDYQQLLNSIRTHIFSLPDETLLIPGHGPDTSVRDEKKLNPFLK